ncbi:hypothetical protein [Paenimyroides baculatum]|uniref:Uncharacterized protein n=1 Tax=Paenimyroides baculatum TaxID=2608000 RepID=A0A5M6CK28_9FLAO|nr:hypothetical protein [Paenimyroides baculatum]KAA5535581.1 hypothetical protein F0460_07315 [Paenimyroides baculatum]
MIKIDSTNFDDQFKVLLENKKGENVITGRFDIESIGLIKKIDFIIEFFSLNQIIGSTIKILFWEKDSFLINLMTSMNVTNYWLATSYKNEEIPGTLYIDMSVFDESVFRQLLINHFNFEMAENPSLNIRVQISLTKEKKVTLLDIYDDRGFDIYMLEKE